MQHISKIKVDSGDTIIFEVNTDRYTINQFYDIGKLIDEKFEGMGIDTIYVPQDCISQILVIKKGQDYTYECD